MVEANILLGGVPFGCDNVGDEAILASIVKLIKSELPGASIMACTDAPEETARLLGISCVPLYGFDRGCGSEESFKNALAWADVFVWAGATGLSDYPEAGMRCMTLAQKCGVVTMVFCTGMNDAINSAYVKLRPGLKKQLLQCFSALCANKFDFVRRKEARKEARIRRALKKVLDRCALVINRDEPSRQNLMRSHLNEVPVVGADPVIILEPRAVCAQHVDASVMQFLNAHQIKFGICISSQQPVLQFDELAAWLDAQIIARGAGIVFIPMNPITDLETSQQILSRMHHKTQVCILKGVRSPEVIAGITQKMDLVISSRLHLLILASLSHTPCLGIERGSKVRVFLNQLGQAVVGTTDCINFTRLDHCVNDVMTRSAEFKAAARNGRKRMHARLERVSSIFGRTVQEVLQRKGEREFMSAKIKESNIDRGDVDERNMNLGG